MSTNSDLPVIETKVQVNLFQKKNLKVDSTGITFGNRLLKYEDIKAIRYGTQKIMAYGINSRKNFFLEFKASPDMKIFFTASTFKKGSVDNNEEKYHQMIKIIWINRTSGIQIEMISKLNKGETVKVGNFTVSQKGVTVTYRPMLFSKKEKFIPWKECLKGLGSGTFYIHSSIDKKIQGINSYLTTWNLNAFHGLMNYLWEDGNCFKLERGEKI